MLPVWLSSVLLFLEKARKIKEDKSVRRLEHKKEEREKERVKEKTFN